MLEELKQDNKVVGIKQLRRALANGSACKVFLAEDADPALTGPIARACEQQNVPCVRVATMRELGAACGICVGAACAAILRAGA